MANCANRRPLVAGLLTLGMPVLALAQTQAAFESAPASAPAPVGFEGWPFRISGCAVVLIGAAEPLCAIADDAMALAPGKNGVDALLEGGGAGDAGAGGGAGPGGGVTAMAGPGASDALANDGTAPPDGFSFTLSVLPGGSRAGMASHGMAQAGAGLAEVLTSYGLAAVRMVAPQLDPALNGAAGATDLSPVNALSVSYDLKLDTPAALTTLSPAAPSLGPAP